MTFSYNMDSPSNMDKVRLILGDTDEADYIFHDEEITTFLALAGSVEAGAAMACRTIAIDSAKQAIAFRALSDSIEIDRTKVPKYFIDLAEKLETGLYAYPIEEVRSAQTGVNWAGQDRTEYVDDEEIM